MPLLLSTTLWAPPQFTRADPCPVSGPIFQRASAFVFRLYLPHFLPNVRDLAVPPTTRHSRIHKPVISQRKRTSFDLDEPWVVNPSHMPNEHCECISFAVMHADDSGTARTLPLPHRGSLLSRYFLHKIYSGMSISGITPYARRSPSISTER